MFCIITKQKLFLFSLIVIVAIAGIVSSFVFASSQTSWGLCFREANKVPEGNATADELLKYDAYFVGDTQKKNIYLTFDVGYEAGFTENILDTLKKNDVKATFFIVGNYFDSNPDTIKRMDEEGHIVANHTLTHPNMSKMSTFEDFKAQIEPNEQKYKNITGKDMKKYYRPPQGVYNTQNLQDAQNLGYKTIFWSVAYVDWERDNQPTHQKAMETLLKRVHDGAIILLHSTSKTNMEILDELIHTLKDQGYVFSSLDELCE